MRSIIILICFILNLSTFAQKEVIVGGYEFPPFVIIENKKPSGITIDLIKELNASQNKYRFTFKLTTANRRYLDFSRGKYDLMFFENIVWGWHEEPIQPSKVILNGGEVFIAKAVPKRNQSFFNSFKDKMILGIHGYHYKFANMVTDKNYLTKYFNMNLGSNHEENIKEVLASDKSKIAIVTKSYLNLFLNEHPEFQDKLLISKKVDQIYRHTILVRSNNSPTTSEINKFIDDLKKKGKLDNILKRYRK